MSRKTPPLTRRMWWVALLGLALFMASGLAGYHVVPDPGRTPAGLPQHMGLALAAALLVFVAQGWFGIYLLMTHRLVTRSTADTGDDELVAASRRLALTTVPFALGAVLGTGLLVALGARILTGDHSAAVHHGLYWATLGLGVGAVILEHRVSQRHDALLARAEEVAAAGADRGS